MVLETPYSSQSQADRAAANYAGESDGTGGGGGGGGGSQEDAPSSSTLSGSIAAPSSIAQGEAFEAGASIQNDSDQAISGTAILGISDGQGKYFPLGRASIDISPGARQGVSFQVTRGSTSDVPTGDRDFAVFADVNRGSGKVASKAVTVEGGSGSGTEGGDGSAREKSNWGEAQHVQELPYGWQLYAQEHKTKDKTRYIIAAKNQAGEVIYLAEDGTVVKKPVYYTSAEEIQAAIQAFAKRAENGNVPQENQPDASQGRPSSGRVTRDADKRSRTGGVSGVLSPVLGPAGEGFGGAHLVAGAVAGGGIYYLWKRRGDITKRQAQIAAGGVAVVLAIHAWGVI